MQIIRSQHATKTGSVLVITMSVLAVAALTIASYLVLVQGQTAAVSRSQNWNSAISYSESGIEDGMGLINNGAPVMLSNAWNWTNTLGANGWSAMVGGQTTCTRYVSASNYYNVTVDISSGTPVITSSGIVPFNTFPWVFASAGGPFVAAGGGSQSMTSSLGRKVSVQAVIGYWFTGAVVTKKNFNMNGNNTTVDSFDSSNPLYSTAGQYNVALRKANGSVATDSSLVGDVNIGNGNIYGHVMTGPGTVQSAVQIGANGAAGNAAWNATSSGVQTGYWSGDFNLNIPDVPTPAAGTTTLPAAVGGVVNLNGGNYTITTSDPNISKPLNITAPTTLWVQGSYSPAGITIATTNGAKLILYVGNPTGSGDSLSLGGSQTLNQPGYAANLQLFGLPSLTSLSMSGNAAFAGTIYAPEADASFGGGGNNVVDSSGSIIVNSLKLNGHWNFHYDEALNGTGPIRSWIAKNWTELKYP